MEKNLLEQKSSGLSLKEFLDKNLDGKLTFETFFGKGSGFCDDTIDQLFPYLIKLFSSGHVKGNTLIQMALAPYIHYIIPACEYFTEIIVGTANDSGLRELEKWRTNDANTVDMMHIFQFVCDREGNRITAIEKHNMLQSKMKQVLIYDVTKSNPFSPVVLPQVDCLLLSHCLEIHALDNEGFCSALKNVSLLLKPGGNLIMIVDTGATFYMVGKFKFPHMCFDVDYLRKTLTDEGFCVGELKEFPRKAVGLMDVCDYSAIIILNARKEAGR
ncbi:nicotinamide N-methyltransferase-like [Ambystoma mexicanum]|uniref:nicotinamide N-methyltransferase-like n=1 Tax=Ambystoma mexicanum TaxID=8296 RepID=UPI0037E8D1FF